MCLSFLHLPRLDSTAYWSRPTSPLYCTAEIIDQASTEGRLQSSFSSTEDRTHIRMFFLSHVLLFVCVAPQSSPRLVWSMLGSPCPLTQRHTAGLIWILLSAGGTAACWGRSVAWHLWKRSWGSKGWVPTEANTQIHLHRLQSKEHPQLLISVCSGRKVPLLCRVW